MASRFRVQWTEQAAADLAGIIRFITLDSPLNASKIYKKIRTKANSLRSFPNRGHVIPELAQLGIMTYRELASPPYRLVYRIDKDAVFVLAVLDGRRDLRQVLSERLLR